MIFPPAVNLVLCVSVFWSNVTYCSHIGCSSIFCLFGIWTLLCHFLHVFYIHETGGQVHFTLSFSILIHPSLPGIGTQFPPCSLILDVFFWFHRDCIFFGVYADIVVWASVKFHFSVGSNGNTVGEMLKMVTWCIIWVLDLLLYLCALRLCTLMSVF